MLCVTCNIIRHSWCDVNSNVVRNMPKPTKTRLQILFYLDTTYENSPQKRSNTLMCKWPIILHPYYSTLPFGHTSSRLSMEILEFSMTAYPFSSVILFGLLVSSYYTLPSILNENSHRWCLCSRYILSPCYLYNICFQFSLLRVIRFQFTLILYRSRR